MDRDLLYFKLDSTFKHILLDEFQDTSIVQFLLLEPLLDEIFSGGDDFRTLFYVGDPSSPYIALEEVERSYFLKLQRC